MKMNHNLLFSLNLSEVNENEVPDASSIHENDGVPSTVTLVRKHFVGKYAIVSEEFTSEMVRLIYSPPSIYIAWIRTPMLHCQSSLLFFASFFLGGSKIT